RSASPGTSTSPRHVWPRSWAMSTTAALPLPRNSGRPETTSPEPISPVSSASPRRCSPRESSDRLNPPTTDPSVVDAADRGMSPSGRIAHAIRPRRARLMPRGGDAAVSAAPHGSVGLPPPQQRTTRTGVSARPQRDDLTDDDAVGRDLEHLGEFELEPGKGLGEHRLARLRGGEGVNARQRAVQRLTGRTEALGDVLLIRIEQGDRVVRTRLE